LNETNQHFLVLSAHFKFNSLLFDFLFVSITIAAESCREPHLSVIHRAVWPFSWAKLCSYLCRV